MKAASGGDGPPTLLVLASTYPRWPDDSQPGFVHELSKRLTGHFRVIVLAPHCRGARPKELFDGVEVVRYRYAPESWETLVSDGGMVANLKNNPLKCLLLPGFVLSQLFAAWRIARSQRADVVHAHWIVPQGLIALLLQWFAKGSPRYVVTLHGADLFALKGVLMDAMRRSIGNRAAAVTVVSRVMRTALAGIGVDEKRISVAPMGVDFGSRFRPPELDRRSENKILFAGRMVEKKGLRYLVSAMQKVVAVRADACLDIAGFGPEEAAIRRQVAELGLQENVRFLGAVGQEELARLYRNAAVFVAPFVHAESGDVEGLGLVVVEAIACGCPVIVGDVPAVSDVVGEVSEVIVRSKNVDELASAILERIESPEKAKSLALELRRHAMARFDWSRVAAGYAKLLQASIAKSQG